MNGRDDPRWRYDPCEPLDVGTCAIADHEACTSGWCGCRCHAPADPEKWGPGLSPIQQQMLDPTPNTLFALSDEERWRIMRMKPGLAGKPKKTRRRSRKNGSHR